MMTVGTGLLIAPQVSCNINNIRKKYSNDMGLQLWSIYKLLQSDQEETLANISKIGFKQVELPMFSNVGSIAPILNKYGLKPTCRHFPFACITGNRDFYAKHNLPILENFTIDSVLEDANKFGLKHLVMPYLWPEERGNIDHYRRIAEQLNITAEKCKEAGIQLNYHNHQFEFIPIEGVLPYDIIVTETDKSLLTFQIDVYFVYAMGMNPAELIKKMGSRVKLLHLKDMNSRNANSEDLSVNQPKNEIELRDETVALGSGLLDFKSILTAARENNVDNCYIEIEGAQSNSLKVLEHSLDYLKTLDL